MNRKYLSILLGGLFAAGCASTTPPQAMAPTPTPLPAAAVAVRSASDAELATQQAKVQALQAQLARSQSDLSSARSAASSAETRAQATALLPPNARPGECYARVLISPGSHTTSETIVVKEASERITAVPPVYENASEQVLVKEASKRLELIPATYETVTERIQVSPAGKRLIEVPATYKTVTESVLERAAYQTWKRGSPSNFSGTGVNVLQSSAVGTGEVMCLVEIPAVYKTITRTVLDQPASSHEVEIPASYETVSKQVMKNPPSSREVQIPAVYKTVSVRRLVKPAAEQHEPIPAVTQTLTKTVVDGEPKLEWRTALCDVNQTHANIAAIQHALKSAGYHPGPIDGVFGKETLEGVNRYARAKRLAYGTNFISMEVVKSLGLNL
jgi:hypothetical protein